MNHENLGPDGRYHTRRLEPPDLRNLQALFERAADYFEMTTGNPPAPDEAPRAFVAGPPARSVNDKRTIGVLHLDELVGVLDAITDWPEDGIWTVGMLLLDPAHRGAGLGSSILPAFEEWAFSQGATRLRTALVSHHDAGLRFLEQHGYAVVSGGTPTVTFLEKTLSPRGR